MADFEQRLALVERALSMSLEVGRKTQNEATALKVVLQTLLSNLTDDESQEALQWLDDMEQIASDNAYAAVDAGIFGLADSHRLDSLTMEIADEDREVIQSQIRELFAPIKSAQMARIEATE